MLKKVRLIIDKIPTNFLAVLVVLLVITILAYGQTLFMYFLIDDNALVYKLQHPDQTLGLWGKSILGEGPYRYRVIQFVPFYPIFGVNPVYYFAIGLVFYYLASIAVYFFSSTVTRSKNLGFASAIIFASGYVGSETMFGITNSWETSRGIILTLTTFFVYYQFLRTRKVLLYLASVALFFLSLDTLFIRSHGLVFAIVFMDIIFSWQIFIKHKALAKSVLFGFLRLLPFILIFGFLYVTSIGDEAGKLTFLKIYHEAFIEGKKTLLTVPFQDIGNLFLPDKITILVDKFVSNFLTIPSGIYLGSTLSGFFALFTLFILTLKFFDKGHLFKVFIFSLLFIVSNFFLFYVREPESSLWTTHRYFSFSFVGLSLFWAVTFYLVAQYFRKKWIFGFFTFLVVVTYLFLGMSYQYEFNTRRSFPAKDFFSKFTHEVPNIPIGAVTYFDLINDNQVKGRFGNFFGGMFSEASNLAIYNPSLDYMNDFIFTYKFDDILKMLADKSTSIDKVYTFFYGRNGLVSTTSQTRQLLINGHEVDLGSFKARTNYSLAENHTVGDYPEIIISAPDDTPSVVPATLSFSLKIVPELPSFPYKTKGANLKIQSREKLKIFSYLLSQSNFRKNATASAASFWKDQEPKYALDGRLETAWRGHRGFWDNIDRKITQDREYFEITLPNVVEIGQLKWISAQKPLVPTHYRILSSVDGRRWNQVTEVESIRALPEGTVIVDSFPAAFAKYIRMEILNTYGNDGPEIKEFEAIESRFTDLDARVVEQIREDPFGFIETKSDYQAALAFVKENAVLRLYFMSDADDQQDPTKYVGVPLVVDGKSHEYSIRLPATGLVWKKFTLSGFNFPSSVEIRDSKISYRSVVANQK